MYAPDRVRNPSPSARPGRRGGIGLLLVVIGLGAAGAPVWGQDDDQVPATTPSQPETEPETQPSAPPGPAQSGSAQALWEAISDAKADPAARLEAVRRLLALPDAAALADRFAQVIGSASPDQSARAIVLQGIASMPVAPAWLLGPLNEAAGTATDDAALLQVVPALGSIKSPKAANVLVPLLGEDRSPAVRSAARAALVRLTGGDQGDQEAWKDWLAIMDRLSEPQWQAVLIDRLSRRVDEVRSAERESATLLVDALRRLHLALPEGERSELLASLLERDRGDLRDLGFELARRELSSARPLDERVAQAALSLLNSPEASVRAQAASLVNWIAPSKGGEAVGRALSRETDAAAAAALLQAGSRWPGKIPLDAVLTWLERSPRARAAAAEAALAMWRAGRLDAEADRQRTIAVLRAWDSISATGPALHLLAVLGNDADRARVAQMLDSSQVERRVSAAEALADRPEYLDRILAAAADDASLFRSAARALAAHRRTAAGYMSLLELPSPSEEERARAVKAMLAVLLPHARLALVHEHQADPTYAHDVLGPLLSMDQTQRASLPPEERSAWYAGVLLLAWVEIDRGDAASALAALDAIGDSRGLLDANRVRDARAVALIMQGQLDAAQALNAPAETWLDALSRSREAPHAAAVAERIRALFPDSLDEAQSRRLEQIVAQIAPPPAQKDPKPPG